MYWPLPDFFQPSPIEQILEKEEYTLEELLNEQDILQECKSLNGRLVAFLRERSTVEQLIRYVVEPASDLDDPKRAYKYPFTACEVLCSEVEAIYLTLLEDNDLLHLLFSILDGESPLSSKTAGYFGRVVSVLLMRKTNELLQYIQENSILIEKLIKHVDTTSIADVIKRLVGADEQPGTLCVSAFAHWLVDTPIIELLLACLSIDRPEEVQTNAADILADIAYTQPSPLATLLAKEECVCTLFEHILEPRRRVFVPLVDICIALVESKRDLNYWDNYSHQDVAKRVKSEAAATIAQHLPPLVAMLHTRSQAAATAMADPSAAAASAAASGAAGESAAGGGGVNNAVRTLAPPPDVVEFQYGVLNPRIGRFCLKVVKLISVLFLHNSEESTEQAILRSGAVEECLALFAVYPFNNVLHDSVTAIIAASFIRPEGSELLSFLMQSCRLVDWLINLPSEVRPIQAPEKEAAAASKPPLRAGYMGHVIRIGTLLEQMCLAANEDDVNQAIGPDGTPLSDAGGKTPLPHQAFVENLQSHSGWKKWCETVLHPRQAVENLSHWNCGRPMISLPTAIKTDDDDFQPALFHQYHPIDDSNEDMYENLHNLYHSSYNEQLSEEFAAMELHDAEFRAAVAAVGDKDLHHPDDDDGENYSGAHGMNVVPTTEVNDDDEVLLAASDDEDEDDEEEEDEDEEDEEEEEEEEEDEEDASLALPGAQGSRPTGASASGAPGHDGFYVSEMDRLLDANDDSCSAAVLVGDNVEADNNINNNTTTMMAGFTAEQTAKEEGEEEEGGEEEEQGKDAFHENTDDAFAGDDEGMRAGSPVPGGESAALKDDDSADLIDATPAAAAAAEAPIEPSGSHEQHSEEGISAVAALVPSPGQQEQKNPQGGEGPAAVDVAVAVTVDSGAGVEGSSSVAAAGQSAQDAPNDKSADLAVGADDLVKKGGDANNGSNADANANASYVKSAEKGEEGNGEEEEGVSAGRAEDESAAAAVESPVGSPSPVQASSGGPSSASFSPPSSSSSVSSSIGGGEEAVVSAAADAGVSASVAVTEEEGAEDRRTEGTAAGGAEAPHALEG